MIDKERWVQNDQDPERIYGYDHGDCLASVEAVAVGEDAWALVEQIVREHNALAGRDPEKLAALEQAVADHIREWEKSILCEVETTGEGEIESMARLRSALAAFRTEAPKEPGA